MKEKRHNYEYDVDTASATAPANVVRLVGKGKRVLEIGCGPGSITKILATEGQCSVTGLELDLEAIEKATPFCEKILQADLNAKNWPQLLDGAERFDVVVAADVLEHLYDPWSTLKKMAPFLNDEGYIVISLPHVGHAAVMSCLMNGNFEYRDWGLLDRTHIRFFCLKNIEDLFSRADLKIVDVSYVTKPPEETEFAAQWARLSSTVKSALKSSPHANIYQVVVKAVPKERVEASLLLRPNFPSQRESLSFATLRRRVGARLSSDSKRRIRKIIGMVGIKL